MPKILPISDLRNNFNKISETCHKEAEPIYITKNGKGDLVVMSLAYFEQLQAKLDLYEKLAVAEAEKLNCAPTVSHDEFMKTLRNKYNA
ncbi:type II toxin-antitoxin system Phd/YefM family antitoxin [Clostridium lacusfryxellense]|uniref:type II toxin-antitoxin system Phd/YefM family antitoxin n=1 Tax=Clostridium lacusfryxellense TaxID=205328 RepID=UPI001C0A97E2|nr:type II toxin-antitoxin system Phd/YefM family antitoxin [Clostridium lacusfryxellense]MBU3112822.1 type II toxin-antitoxin system Phd/YefM family antitoxin [Clostridium lacusfryxellense]